MNTDPPENIWNREPDPLDPAIPAAEQGPPEKVFLDLTNRPGEPLSWSESLKDIIGPEE